MSCSNCDCDGCKARRSDELNWGFAPADDQIRRDTPPKPDLQTAMAAVREAGYLVTPPDRPTDRINLANLRRVMGEWHSMAISLGYDGVKEVLEQAGAPAAQGRPEH